MNEFVSRYNIDDKGVDELKEKLQEIFGTVDMQSPVWEWEHTDYYQKELGAGLKRQFIF